VKFSMMTKFLFIVSIAILAFGYGFLSSQKSLFPYSIIRDGHKTLTALIESSKHATVTPPDLVGPSNVPNTDLLGSRVRYVGSHRDVAAATEKVMFFGGPERFLDVCGGNGCIAVTMERDGRIVQAYPYLPQEMYAANQADDYKYEYLEFDPERHMRPIGIEMYPNGDLLVTFQRTTGANLFPFGAGLARIGLDGKPRWFHMDYSHHWPTLLSSGDALVPGLAIGDQPIRIELPGDHVLMLRCSTEKPLLDRLRVVNGRGEIMQEFPLLEAFLRSPFRAVLQHTTDHCDPLHLNFIDRIGEDSAKLIPNAAPGDYIVSFRNISSLAIVDKQSGEIKRLIRGSFVQQHSIHHLADSRFILFDNQGAGGHSRLLEINLATGLERTIFPNIGFTEKAEDVFSMAAGYVDLSTERQRAIVCFSNSGKSYEVRLSDGKVLAEFTNTHDLSSRAEWDRIYLDNAAILELLGINYVDDVSARE
jgi:hypothetical protein